ncbi:D-mannonate oxidoreductase [Stappia aggregata IAM 12614]|uniref:D-mannonate oxidoreductase n=1 Tax=Roseibium aggregatum (strain ATCC 25650 / DSM 13394 / JCM 20685 / NBRC 16684 / NCIMB 2208 / IAM 12614 / B1) TaxID=384765 RepID=A0P410_ROSAI|nr:mannitol dehydrogenase family protein [Roseibium aggregatum]EAV40220.1 D-mannonate oxidoreductase [Stappia aggregata IAM 12614] [Roseibium aggregatum IAM 12614]
MTGTKHSLETVDYDRTKLRIRLLHIGFGAFAKAHVLVFHDEMLRQTKSDWGVAVTRLNSGADDLTRLDEADGIYTVGEMSGDDLSLRQVGAICATVHPKRDGIDALPDRIADPDLAVITLTITEKGYCLKDGKLDEDNAGIRQDLATPEAPSTAIGVLVEGLRRRQAAGLAGLTILSCDNLPANGELCRRAVLDFAARLTPVLAAWIETNCTFPCSMVDRITPAMTDSSFETLENALGHKDRNGILCETFRQWVIEDRFAGARPDWHLASAEFVDDVAPFEEMKLRMLNGSHSFLAYLGALAGKETIAGCMADPVFRQAALDLMLSEQAPTLTVPDGVDIKAYAEALIARFENTALHHKTTQIASDGSQKLPQRLLAPIRQHLKDGSPWTLSALAVAGWMFYCRGVSKSGSSLPLNDPMSSRIEAIVQETDGADYVDKMLSLSEIFGDDLSRSEPFTSALKSAYQRLQSTDVTLALKG